MRLLLSDGNASKSNGVYTFSLDKRPSNATTVRVRKADFQYTVPTGSVAPLVPLPYTTLQETNIQPSLRRTNTMIRSTSLPYWKSRTLRRGTASGILLT